MSFRERPEYQNWRDAVFKLFGRRCILCGHNGNITAHYVLAVNTYPELAFDPANGVPVCGNCHTQVNGNEDAYVDGLKRRQRELLNGGTTYRKPRRRVRRNCDNEPNSILSIPRPWYDGLARQVIRKLSLTSIIPIICISQKVRCSMPHSLHTSRLWVDGTMLYKSLTPLRYGSNGRRASQLGRGTWGATSATQVQCNV